MRGAGSAAPASTTPTVSHTATAARSRARGGGAALTMNSAMDAVRLAVATVMVTPCVSGFSDVRRLKADATG